MSDIFQTHDFAPSLIVRQGAQIAIRAELIRQVVLLQPDWEIFEITPSPRVPR
jgi:hypothetical protein